VATIVDTFKNEEGETINVYESGAQYNTTRGRLIRAPERSMFTPETSPDAHRKKAELKRQRLLAGAAKVLESSADWEMPDDLDVVEAIGEAAMLRAMDGDIRNSKQIDAMRFILNESGLAEKQTLSTASALETASASALGEIVAIMREIMQPAEPIRETIDGTATDIRNADSPETGVSFEK